MMADAMVDDRLLSLIGGQAMLRRAVALSGGCIAPVIRLELVDGRCLVAKRSAHARIEARMLRDLAAAGAPVPMVTAQEGEWLVMTDLGGRPGLADAQAARAAGRALAGLHAHTGPHYGYPVDVVIGPLPQDNTPCDDWLRFYGRHRLMAMAEEALQAGRLSARETARVARLAARLAEWLPGAPPPALLHGDFWHGNILSVPGRLCGFIDPAISWGDPNVDLAMLDLFGALDEAFLTGYREVAGKTPAIVSDPALMALYQLWPLLVHVRLFGGSYLAQTRRILGGFGV